MNRIKEKLKNWLIEKSQTKSAPFWLGLLSFAESSFFPIPPDFLLIPIFSLLEAVFVIIYTKSSISLIVYSFFGWIIKNIGWGMGIFVGLINLIFKKKHNDPNKA